MANGWETIAEQLQEALKLSHGDVAKALDSHLETQFPGQYSHVMDVFGDASAGDVVYHQGGKMQKAPYTIAKADGKHTATIDHKSAKQVTARTVYDAKESAVSESEVDLTESAACFVEDVPLLEAVRAVDYPVKLIQPGRGSSGYYPAEVLERDGPKIFTSGTHMYWNHATQAEESQRPEGNLDHLAAVLTSNAYYDKTGKAGEGLYARAKVFSDYAEKVSEKAPHTGLSIRARGIAEGEGRKAPDGKAGLIKALTRGESVDFVTRAGAGGKLLTESARTQTTNESQGEQDMDATELRALQESNARLSKRLIRADAKEAAQAQLEGVSLPTAARRRIIERSVAGNLPERDGDLDTAAFKAVVERELQSEAAYLKEVNPGLAVTGMGAAPQTAELTEAQRVEREKQRDRSVKEAAGLYGVRTEQGISILREGRSAFNAEYNSRSVA